MGKVRARYTLRNTLRYTLRNFLSNWSNSKLAFEVVEFNVFTSNINVVIETSED